MKAARIAGWPTDSQFEQPRLFAVRPVGSGLMRLIIRYDLNVDRSVLCFSNKDARNTDQR